MDSLQDLRDLTSHADWADATIWQCVLSDEERLYHPQVAGWLHHIHTVQKAFLSLWRSSRIETPELDTFARAEVLAEWGRRGHLEIRRHLWGDELPDLGAEVSIPWARHIAKRFGRAPEAVSLRQTAMQVAIHSAHHRGQVAAKLRELGGEPPLVDFIAWLWLGRPEAEWPVLSPTDA